MIAMVAVGLWGAQLGSPAIWLLPITFPLMMALGGAAAGLGLTVPGVEIGIAVSALLLGIMVATAARPALPLAMLLVGIFGVLHGHAHGTELPEAMAPLAYGLGFVIATGLLHLAGILLGLLNLRPFGVAMVRICGAAIALTGGWYLAMRLGALA
jgi:urease accessory protein